MNNKQWTAFCSFRDDFKAQVALLEKMLAEAKLDKVFASYQRELALEDNVPPYEIETPLVYNTALDSMTKDNNIKLIVIGDNPGKDEQLAKNRRYLVGQSGKLAEGFFKNAPELDIDFRKDTLILNKTFIHTAKTKELKKLKKKPINLCIESLYKDKDEVFANDCFATILEDSQIWMAKRTVQLHKELCLAANNDSQSVPCKLWIIGYSELKNRGIFNSYAQTITKQYTECLKNKNTDLSIADSVFVFQHFSMNRFLIDLRSHSNKDMSLKQNLENLGRLHRKEILSF